MLEREVTNATTIEIPDYDKYNWIYITVRGDFNNGVPIAIPKAIFNSTNIPISLDSTFGDTSYTIKLQGYFSAGTLNISYIKTSIWNAAIILVFGLN